MRARSDERGASRHFGSLRVAWFGGLLLSMTIAAPCAAQRIQFGSDATADSIESIQAKTPRSEQQEDRLLAAARFGYGRMLLQHGDMAAGLRQLQRAYRWDPAATLIARDIVPVASTLGRHAEAVRYAILSAERDPDLKIILPLGEILAEQGEFQRAIRLLEKGLAMAEKEKAAQSPLLRAELGRLYLLIEQFAKAAESLSSVREVLESAENSEPSAEIKSKLVEQKERWYTLLGEAYVRTRRYDDALRMYAKANEAKPDEATFAVHRAFVATEKGDWNAARKALDEYFASSSTSSSSSTAAGLRPYELLERAITAQSPNKSDSTKRFIDRLEQICQADAKNVVARHILAAKYFELDRLDEAASLLVPLMKIKPTPSAFRSLAEIYRRKKDAAGYLDLLGRGVDSGELTRELLDAQAVELGKDEHFFKQLVELARSEADSSPRRGPRSVGISLLLISAKQFELSREFHEQAIAAKGMPEHKVHELLGMSFLLAQQPEEAAKLFSRAIEAAPADETAAAYHFYRSGALALANQHEAALEAANTCAKLAPNTPQFVFRPAWVLYNAKNFDESRRLYEELLKKFDDKFDSSELRDQLRQARLVLSNIAVMENQIAVAEEWLEQVLDEFPEDAGARNDLGYLWADGGKHLNRALAMCQAAVQAEPDNGAYRDSLGWAYYRLGKYQHAIEELEKAAELTPDGVIFDHLGDAYSKAQQMDKAKEAWRKAVASFAEENDSQKHDATKSKLEKIDHR